MVKKLNAIVVGAGWAGEGHTLALRAADVEVIALCGRSLEPTQKKAEQLNIPEVRLDWRKALDEFHPDIVAIATPGDVHCEIALAGAELGAHLLCDKPLGLNAHEAGSMLQAVTRAGVKHAYASTSQYEPIYQYCRQLLAEGVIGQVWQAEYMNHWYFLSPQFSWVNQLSLGGGFLNNAFTHQLGQVLRMTGAKVRAVSGKVTSSGGLVPVGPPVHDFRSLFGSEYKPEATTAWKETDADFAFSALVEIVMPDGSQVCVHFQGSAQSIGNYDSYIAFYGKKGTLRINFGDPQKILLATAEHPEWKEMPVPQAMIDRLPKEMNRVQRDWNQLCLEFVADIQGQGYAGYPTFQDGWIANQVIDGIRSGSGWVAILD